MAIVRLVVHRILLAIPLLFIVSALTFVLLSLVPGDAAHVIAGEHATLEQYQEVRRQLGLDQPLIVQYWNWLTGVFHGDLGASLFTHESVTAMINQRIPVSLSLMVLGTVVSGILGIGLGMLSALRGGAQTKIVDALAMLGLAIPSFWIALVLIAIFAVGLRWFPVTGYVPLEDSPAQWLHSLILPVVALTLATIAIVAKQTRDSILDTLSKDFVRVMQANGFSRRSVLYRHVLRNSALPVVTVLGLVFIHMLTAAIFVETVFAMPGVASLIQQAALQHDLPVLQGTVIYVTLFVVIVNLLVDLAYGALDPKVRR